MSDNVYSYHTFLAPFIWQIEKNKNESFSKFCEKFEGPNSKWERNSVCDLSKDSETARENYAALQYFCPSIHDSIFDMGKNSTKNKILHAYSLKKFQNKASYIIEKEKKKDNGKKEKLRYTLSVNDIKLKIYNTGIAILVFECENRNHPSFKDVKNINDYGRRISLPFIPEKPDASSICADTLSLRWEENGQIQERKTDFRSFIEENQKQQNINTLKSKNAEFVCNVLNYDRTENLFTTEKNCKENEYFIKLALDDRMYVMSMIVDTNLKEAYLQKNDNSKMYVFEEDENLSKALYEYVFVDSADDCSCQDDTMRSELLKKHLDRRWFNYGSLYGASQRSLVAFTTENKEGNKNKEGDEEEEDSDEEGNKNHIVNSFLTQYMQIACLAVACYATLAKFEEDIAEISTQETSSKKNKEVLDIRERFLKYRSQLGGNNITFQEQGIELSEMVRTALGIKQSEETITKRLDALFSAADYKITFNFNTIGWFVAILETAAVYTELIQKFLDNNGITQESMSIILYYGLYYFLPFIVPILIYKFVRRYFKNKT